MPSSPSTIRTTIDQSLVFDNDGLSQKITEELRTKLNEKISDNTTIVESGNKSGDSGETMSHQHLPNDDGLILPKKLANPVKENSERLNLHRELLFNQKIGKNVLNQKSELQKALEKHKDHIAKKELENHIAAQAPELEKVIADRAKRLQISPNNDNDDERVISKEFLEARMKLKKS